LLSDIAAPTMTSQPIAIVITFVKVAVATNVFVLGMVLRPPVVPLLAFVHCMVILVFLYLATNYNFRDSPGYKARYVRALSLFSCHVVNMLLFYWLWISSEAATDLRVVVLQAFVLCLIFYAIVPFSNEELPHYDPETVRFLKTLIRAQTVKRRRSRGGGSRSVVLDIDSKVPLRL